MKISNSKKELARIISENGGWREGEFAAQDSDGGVGGYEVKPEWNSRSKYWWRPALGEWFLANKIKNHHQTVLSRAEYFHLYPVMDDGLCAKVTEENKHQHVDAKPTIEQLAADYRNKLDFANNKQQEADDAKAAAGAALGELERAGEALGLLVSPITEKQEPEHELVITDWRDLQVGDEIEVFNFECPESESRRKQELMSGPCVVMQAEGGNVRIELKKNLPTKGSHWNATGVDACEFKFIRRP